MFHIGYCAIFSVLFPHSIPAQAGLFGPDCDLSEFNKSKIIRYVDQNSVFSIAVPTSWKVKKKKDGGYSELLIKSKGSCKIMILISTRLLNKKEKSVSTLRLIDSMLKFSLEHLRNLDHQILGYGKYKEFKKGWPAFVISSIQPGGEKSTTSYGSVIENRNLSIVLVAYNKQHSDGLAEILRRVIDSIEIL